MNFKEIFTHGWRLAFRSLQAMADLILPRVCVVCGDRLLLREKHLCLHCLADLPLTRFWEMKDNHMADKFNALIQAGLEMTLETEYDADIPVVGRGPSIRCHEPYAHAAALFFFSSEAPYRHILYNIKYEGRTDIGKHFGKMLGVRLAGSDVFKDVDCVMPVPLHWIRRWRRGYNQAEVIAREVASAMGAPLDCRTLVRRRRTRTQTRLDIQAKAANVAGAFEVRKGSKSRNRHQPTEIRHILLIDDVFTTGSTLMACFTALREVFPPGVRISVATLAFVGGG